MTVTKPILDHEHGRNNNRCGHPDCLTAVNRYRKQWVLERSRGRLRLTDAGPARNHVFTLVGRQWSLRAIAGASGLSATTISKVTKGQGKITHPTSQAILTITPQQVPSKPSSQTSEPFVSKVGAVRRIQALLWLGHSHETQRLHSGVTTAVMLNQKGNWITRTNHDKIAAMYRELSRVEGFNLRTRGRARKYGYLGPAAWDNIDLDPTPDLDECQDVALKDEEAVDEAAVLRRMNGDRVRLSVVDATEVVRRCLALRWSWNDVERITGLKPDRYMDKDEDEDEEVVA